MWLDLTHSSICMTRPIDIHVWLGGLYIYTYLWHDTLVKSFLCVIGLFHTDDNRSFICDTWPRYSDSVFNLYVVRTSVSVLPIPVLVYIMREPTHSHLCRYIYTPVHVERDEFVTWHIHLYVFSWRMHSYVWHDGLYIHSCLGRDASVGSLLCAIGLYYMG